MVDTSYAYYRKLRRVARSAAFIDKRSERTQTNWEAMPEKQRQTVIAGLIQDAVARHGDGWERLLDGDPELTYEAARKIHDESGRGSFLTFISLSQWNSMEEVERRTLVDIWRSEALALQQANTPESEVTPW